MTTDSSTPVDRADIARPEMRAPGARPRQLEVLVVGADAAYCSWVTEALAADPLASAIKIHSAVDGTADAQSRSLEQALEGEAGSVIDLVLLDATVSTDTWNAPPAEKLTARGSTVVMQRCESCRLDHRQAGLRRDHRVLFGGVLNKLEGLCLNLAALPIILRFAIERNEANAAARDYNEQLHLLGDLSPGAILIVDENGSPRYSNESYRSLTGMTRQDMAQERTWCEAVHPDDRPRVDEAWRSAASRGEHLAISFRLLHSSGRALRVRARGRMLPAMPGTRDAMLTAFSMEQRPAVASISTLRAAEQALFQEKEHSRLLLESIDEAVILTDGSARITVFNPVAEVITGWTQADALGQPVGQVLNLADSTTRQPLPDPAQAVLDGTHDGQRHLDCLLLGRSGSEQIIECLAVPLRDRSGSVDGALVVFHDQLQSRVVAEHMAYLAYHDVLTGLPNRALLLERMTQAIRLAQRNGSMLALVFTDINDFKVINDSLGHDAGDELLVMAAHRLRRCVRTTDTICRYGGDEYVALLTEVDRPEDALHVAEKMTAAMHRSFNLDGHTVRVTMSAGTSVYPFDGRNAKALLESADKAMYEAKRCHKRKGRLKGAAQMPKGDPTADVT